MAKYLIKYGQTVCDVSFDIYQDVSFAFDLIKLNPVLDNITNTDIAGIEIDYEEKTKSSFKSPSVTQSSIVRTYLAKDGQTIIDVSFDIYKDVSFSFDLIKLNSQVDNISSDLTGMTITYQEVTKEVFKSPEIVSISGLKNVTIGEGQTLQDVSLQIFGRSDKVFDVMRLAGIDNVSQDIKGINFSYEQQKDSVSYHIASNKLIFATRYPLPIDTAPPIVTGSYRIIETGEFRIIETGDRRILN